MLRLTTTFEGGPGLPGYNNLYFGGTTSGEAIAANSLVSSVMDAFGGYMHTSVDMVGPQVVELVDVLTGQVTDEFPVTPFAQGGIINTDLLPHATQALIRFRTGTFVNGRRLRGRMFIPGQVDAKDVSGQPSTAYIAELQVIINNLLSGASGAGGLVIYSPTHRDVGAVISGSPWEQWAVLRSRRPV